MPTTDTEKITHIETLLSQIVEGRESRPGVGLTNREIESLLTIPNRMLAVERRLEVVEHQLERHISDVSGQLSTLSSKFTGDSDKPGLFTRLLMLESDANRMRWLASILIVAVSGLLVQRIVTIIGQ